MKRIRDFLQDNALMVSGMLLMLASAGVDGKFLSMWMSDGMGWMGYILNLVSDASGYVMSNAYGRLQNDDDERKHNLSKVLLVGEFINIAYSWLFSYLVLRDRFMTFFTRPIFGNLTVELEVLAFVSAGFVPLSLVFLGYADSLNKTKPKRRRANVTKAVSNLPKLDKLPDKEADVLTVANATRATQAQQAIKDLLTFYADSPMATQAEAGMAVSRSRQWVSSKLAELETEGAIRRNGHGVELVIM